MDIPRPFVTRKRKVRRTLYGVGLLILLPAVGMGLSQLKRAAPSVDRATVWLDTVKRGPLLREVRGQGVLVPEVIRWIPAGVEGHIEQRFVLPGSPVKQDTVLLLLSNPELEQSALDAQWQMKGAEADLTNLRAQLENQFLNQRAGAGDVEADYRQAKLQAATNRELFRTGLVSELALKLSELRADQLASRNEVEQKRLNTFGGAIAAQLAAQQSRVAQLRALVQLKQSQVKQLRVRAGIEGVLQALQVEVGQRVTVGTVLALVVRPNGLKAQLKIPERQATDIQIGQKVLIDMHNGTTSGHVTRIDPAVSNRTVTMDITLDGPLPEGARPDQSVEGSIEIERLADVLYVGRPVHGDTGSRIALFKLLSNGKEAVQVQIKLGRTSVNAVEIVEGLRVGDQVVLSDMSAWNDLDRVRLK